MKMKSGMGRRKAPVTALTESARRPAGYYAAFGARLEVSGTDRSREIHRRNPMRLMRTLSTIVLAAALVVGCTDSTDPAGPEQLDVSGVWTATLDGTVIHGEDGTGQTTFFTLTLVQSGTEVTGTGTFTDTLNRSGSSAGSGTLIGDSLSFTHGDFDQQCDGRTFTNTATVTSTTPGSTVSINFSASAKGICPPISGTLTYTKQ